MGKPRYPDERLADMIRAYRWGKVVVYDNVGRSTTEDMTPEWKADLFDQIALGIAERGGRFACDRLVYRIAGRSLVGGLPL